MNVLTRGKKAKADRLALDNRLDEARSLYESVCKTDPTDVEAWVKLSVTARRLGRHEQAEECGRRAVTLAPGQAYAHHALASAMQCLGKTGEAMAGYRRAIQLKPDYPDPHYLLGNALMEIGLLHEAEVSLRRALDLRPVFFEALSDLGALLLSLSRSDEAAAVLQRALVLQPDSPEVLANLATLSEKQGRVDEALGLYDRALRSRPDSSGVLAKRAELLEKAGRVAEAEATLARGLAREPRHPALNLVAARLERRAARHAEAATRLEAVLGQPMAQDTGTEIHLLLGQLYDRLGDTDKVLPLLIKGKRRVALATDPDGRSRAGFLVRVESSRAWVSDQLAGALPAAPTGDAPIFLVGFPRSGTTLLEQVLDSHPRLQTLEEKPMAEVLEQAFVDMTGGGAEALANLSEEQIARLRGAYWEEAERLLDRRAGASLVDKLPLNIVRVPLLWRVFPEARFILAIRHPCDVALSCLMQNFGHNDAMAGFVSLDSIAQIYSKVMGAWIEYAARLPLRWQRVRYEDLITNFEAEARQLLEFLGVGWDDAVLDHTRHAQERNLINTPSYHQVTQPLYQHAKYRWKRYQQAFVPLLPILQPFIREFGYGEPEY